MGVDLSAILVKKELAVNDVKGTLAIDAYNTLYQFLTTIRQRDGTPLMNARGEVTSHLSGLFYRTCNFIEKGIKPVYVFDGKPPDLKQRTLRERKEAKEEAERKYIDAVKRGDQQEAFKYVQRTVRLDEKAIEQSKRLLTLLGVPWIQAPSEGEAQCSAMCAEGLVSATASQDYDSLLFGTPKLYRNLALAGKRKLPGRTQFVDVLPQEYILEDNLRSLQIDRKKLVWIGMLIGTDYNEGIHGIGPKKALKLVLKHNDFPSILEEAKAEMDWQVLEDAFLKPAVRPVEKTEIIPGVPDRDALIAFMCNEHGFLQERVESTLAKVFAQPLGTEQGSLNKWM